MSPYDPIVEKALVAFATDAGYLEAMLSAAQAIIHKRSVWDVRLELRAVADRAIEECKALNLPCECMSPCGFGDCRYADPMYKDVRVISTRGRSTRIEGARFPDYEFEDVMVHVQAPVRRMAG